MKSILKVNNLTKYYGKILGVKDVSFELLEGEVFGFIGPNGAGKSTTIRAVLNLINKTSGEVFFCDEVYDKDNIKLKSLIGYLPSEISLYEDYTVKEMLDYHETFYKKDISKRRKELVKRFKIDESKMVEDLSLGNLKKLGIVLAFMHEPKLLILDEPTSGLDPIMQQEFYQLLKEEKEKGTTIFYSTHLLSEVEKICDRVGIIKDGKLLKIEPIKDLLTRNLSYVTIKSDYNKEIIKKLKVEIIHQEADVITFKNEIDINKVISVLSKYEIKHLTIEAATLEDIFLHYYE